MGLTFEDLGAWPGVLGRLTAGQDLSTEEAQLVLGNIVAGQATEAQIAAFVTALRMKGATVDEMAGLVRAMLEHADPLVVEGDLLDTCGTGGDKSRSVNVSTMAAVIAAGAGVKVCKHGNRAATSSAGSADVLEALGVAIDLGPAGVKRCIDEIGFGFCFAPRFHAGMRFAVPVRAQLGVPTIFNFLGPLANPARARFQVVGVSDPSMADKMLGVLMANGAQRAIVVYGHDGLDELSTTGVSTVVQADRDVDGSVMESVHRTIAPVDFGLAPVTLEQIRGGDAAFNASVVREVVEGKSGPHRDIAVLNAAAGLVAAGRVADFHGGVELATAVLDDGRAGAKLDALIELSSELKKAG